MQGLHAFIYGLIEGEFVGHATVVPLGPAALWKVDIDDGQARKMRDYTAALDIKFWIACAVLYVVWFLS
jgi:hypothetical protein